MCQIAILDRELTLRVIWSIRTIDWCAHLPTEFKVMVR